MDGSHMVRGCGCDAHAETQSLLSHMDARDLALNLVNPIEDTEIIPLTSACGRYTAQDVYAPQAMPFFDNAAMDGFALRLSDLAGRCCLPVAGTVAAGDAPRTLPDGAALRIYTGAPLPDGADTVVMIEACIDKGDRVHIDRMPGESENIRRAGSDQAKGQLLVAAHTRLAPHHIGLLAANGLTQITAVRRPRVAVFSTGDELTEGTCAPGRIPDANRPMLLALLTQAGAAADDLGILPDDPVATTAAFHALGDAYDLIVTTGAVSLGGKDHIRAALTDAGGDIHAWRVALKPGKPVMFGTLRQTAFTGLPGNPFAVHVGFYLFVAPQIARLTGGQIRPYAQDAAIAGFDWHRKAGRAEVFPVRRTGNDASGLPVLERLGNSVSATLLPLSGADGLAMVPAHLDAIVSGDALQWHPFCLDGDNT
ncbi:gephyrin-like molybdotransferase Glp [Roseovarius sp. M141]|uniref:molybdopterin molybdotransferase MoeA n=1 Tax=Roseovarius sp. M141 TaxID=2583806 RepID=UPI0020CD7EFA|nr:gephyrin-like molybdotransferase Glp [Roseovarius sp. M141]MCQ0091377.1 molybdopterin molybdotransferase MoeA [Roseovarius sp. M141]